MASSDQPTTTTTPVPGPTAIPTSNPDATNPPVPPIEIDAPTPTQPANSTAPPRKLPVKRKSPLLPSSPSSPSSFSADAGPTTPVSGPTGDRAPPPFKFQRIWSESDEIRFLQGLLGCYSQGLVFPRDLNIFYDRFSESMPQPYTRSQLSEKLRRLRNKYRSVSSRVAGGQDPSRLAPHDRDVLHLCSRLWDPAFSASSPFSSDASGGVSGNKRRRANPRSENSNCNNNAGVAALSFNDLMGVSDDAVEGKLYGNADEVMMAEHQQQQQQQNHVGVKEEVHVGGGNGGDKNGSRMARAVLDMFEECLREVKVDERCGVENEFEKRWREQRIAELDVLSRRLRLMVEDDTLVASMS